MNNRNIILRDKDNSDIGTLTVERESAANVSVVAPVEKSLPETTTAPQRDVAPSDDKLSKISFDVGDLDEDKMTAPSEDDDSGDNIVTKPIKSVDGVEVKQKPGEQKSEKTVTRPTLQKVDGIDSPVPEVHSTRDYTNFPEAIRPLVKKLPNQVFDFVKELYPKLTKSESDLAEVRGKLAEAEKGIVKIPDSYHEHPNAFILDPQFQTTHGNLTKAEFEAQFYTTQLEQLESGEPIQYLAGYDKSGNPVYGDKIARPSAKDKVKLASNVSLAHNYAAQFSQQIESIQKNFSTRHKQETDRITSVMTKLIPWEAEPKLLDDVVVNEKGEKSNVKTFLSKYMEAVPPVFQNHVMSKAWVNTMMVNFLLNQEMAKLRSELDIAKTNQNHQSQAQPTGQFANATSASKFNTKTFNAKDMDD